MYVTEAYRNLGKKKSTASTPLTPAGALPTTTIGTLVPGQAGLDTALSGQISELLNPPTSFADTDRRAAELGAARGIAGSEAMFGTGLRMTDEERLKRIALGEQLMSSMSGRNQPNAITPIQQAELALKQKQLDLEQERANREAAWQSFMQTMQTNQFNANNPASSTPGGFRRNMYGQLVGVNTGEVGHNYTSGGGGWGW